MQILSITDSIDGQAGSWSGKGGRVYTNSLIVITDDARVGPRAVVQGLGLSNGDSYRYPVAPGTTAVEWDYGSFIDSVDAAKDAEDGCQWKVTIKYLPFDWASQGGATGAAAALGQFDPFAIPPQVQWGSQKFEAYLTKDANGNPLQNTAGDPFDPPPKRDDSRPVLTIVRNEATFDPLYAGNYKDTCNGTVFLGYDINTVKCDDIVAKREYHADYGYYWEVTYTFTLRLVRYDSSNVLIDNGWTEEILNCGLRQISVADGNAHQILIDKAPVSAPVLLNKAGQYIGPSSGVTATPIYLEFQIYPQMDYTVFNFPSDMLTVSSVPGLGGS